jgi:hypothetical protein
VPAGKSGEAKSNAVCVIWEKEFTQAQGGRRRDKRPPFLFYCSRLGWNAASAVQFGQRYQGRL